MLHLERRWKKLDLCPNINFCHLRPSAQRPGGNSHGTALVIMLSEPPFLASISSMKNEFVEAPPSALVLRCTGRATGSDGCYTGMSKKAHDPASGLAKDVTFEVGCASPRHLLGARPVSRRNSRLKLDLVLKPLSSIASVMLIPSSISVQA